MPIYLISYLAGGPPAPHGYTRTLEDAQRYAQEGWGVTAWRQTAPDTWSSVGGSARVRIETIPEIAD